MQRVNQYLASPSTVGTVDDAFTVVVRDVIGSTGDRANAANVVITIGDGDGTTAQSTFGGLEQHARYHSATICTCRSSNLSAPYEPQNLQGIFFC